ncbi:hypothetical protein EDB87DRAFT_1638370 [Lactarius vividus]|nr:hypothetical protein EDB87DRAFT_1638370 [Lactarius vividus]
MISLALASCLRIAFSPSIRIPPFTSVIAGHRNYLYAEARRNVCWLVSHDYCFPGHISWGASNTSITSLRTKAELCCQAESSPRPLIHVSV